jgi:hypothetical protein
MSLDFQQAYRISHQYLFEILHVYGISPWLVQLLRALYEQATATTQINGVIEGNIPIRFGVRQGCPLGVVLYALCLQPFSRMLEEQVPKMQIGNSRHGPVTAYADDVTVFITRVGDFDILKRAIQNFERATGARLNPRKFQARPGQNPQRRWGYNSRRKLIS